MEKYPSGRRGSPAKGVVCESAARVQIPPSPPNKNRNFDTMRIKVAVLSFCQKALIPRGFWLLSAPAVARQSESLPPAQYAKALGSSRLSFGLWVSFNQRQCRNFFEKISLYLLGHLREKNQRSKRTFHRFRISGG